MKTRYEKKQLLYWSFTVDLYVCDQIMHIANILDSLILLVA